MHKLESFALSTGSKINRPWVDQCYYPVLEDKFICVSQNAISSSKSYTYFSDVLFHIKPYLDKEKISIIEVGQSNADPIFYTKNFRDLTRLQANYVINKSLLYFGNFNFLSNSASALNKPTVIISNNDIPNTFKPYWSNDDNCKILIAETDNLPTFSDKEEPKTIDQVYPEKIAAEILSMLGIDHNLDSLNTIHLGSEYSSSVLDVVPGSFSIDNFRNQKNINIRLDKHFDLKFLISCKELKNISITTDQVIPQDILFHIKDSVQAIYFHVNKNTTKEEVDSMHSGGNPLFLQTKDKNNLNKIRLNLIEFPVNLIEKFTRKDVKSKTLSNLTFLSKRNIIHEGKAYNSYLSIAEKSNISKVLNKKEFWEDLPYCRIFEKNS
jgi:hypothetical protein